MNIVILYEDETVLVIEKPFGSIVNRSATAKYETVQDWTEQKLQIKNEKGKVADENLQVFLDRSGVAHRLDKDTSGCLLIAKTPESLANLLQQFKQRTVHKEYIALVHGAVKPEKGSVNAPIGRLPWRRGLFGIMPGGKPAVSHYEVKGFYKLGKEIYSLLGLTIETGRTHQIRVHLQYIGHPVVGDVFYAGRKRTRKTNTWCPRLFLHAKQISFISPDTNKQASVEGPLPEDLQTVLKKLIPTNHDEA